MAILERLPGVSAVILVNGEEVTEHHDEDEISVEHENPAVVAHQKQRTVSTWIPAEDDAFFQIKVAVDPEYGMMNCSKLGFEIKVDGEFIWTSHCHRPRREDNEEYWEDVVSQARHFRLPV